MSDLFQKIRTEKAFELLNVLNADLKQNEKYQDVCCFDEKGFTVYVVANKSKDIMMNILDFEGNIPEGFSANWRTFEHIKTDLKLN